MECFDSQDLVQHGILHLRPHKEGRKIFVATQTGRICILDVKVFGSIGELFSPAVGLNPCHFDISPDGQWVICGGSNGSCTMWRADDGKRTVVQKFSFR